MKGLKATEVFTQNVRTIIEQGLQENEDIVIYNSEGNAYAAVVPIDHLNLLKQYSQKKRELLKGFIAAAQENAWHNRNEDTDFLEQLAEEEVRAVREEMRKERQQK